MSSATTDQAQGGQSHFLVPSLNGIRGMSFLVVLLAHLGLAGTVPGGFGVTVFFLLSGYLIATLLRLEYEKSGTISFRQFYLRRVLRIFPPYYLVLAAAALAWTLAGVRVGAGQLLAQAFYLTNYLIVAGVGHGIPPGTGVTWSLAIEEHFYILFPLLYLLLSRRLPERRHQFGLLMGLCLLALTWRCVLVYGYGLASDRTYYATDTRFDSILFGCALAVYGNPALDPPFGSERFWKRVVVPIIAGVLLFCFLYRDPSFRATWRYTLQGLALMAGFIVVVRFPDWFPCRFLNSRALNYLALLSYSGYLVHLTVILLLQAAGLSRVAVAVLGISITWSVAHAFYVFVERPAGKLRKRLAKVV